MPNESLMLSDIVYNRFQDILVDLPDHATKVIITLEMGEPVSVEVTYYQKERA